VGFDVSGTTTLYDADGTRRLQWVRANAIRLRDAIDIIRDAFGEPAPALDKLQALEKLKETSLHTIYPIADLHFGMYSWKEECGDDYDTNIAERILASAFGELLGRAPDSDIGVILNLGDFFHSDSDEQTTRRSGNKLDCDTRWARVQRAGIALLRRTIDMARLKHKTVIVKNIPGNHDPYGTLALTNALALHYEDSKQVYVDVCADPVWVYQFGKVLISAAHGDMVKPTELPGNVAANAARLWGLSKWRYGYLGHEHKKRGWKPDSLEQGGMEVEVFRTIAPKDAWATQKGFTSRRSLVAVTHHHERGEVDRKTVNIESRGD
jgi:hypothetical protein